MTYFMTNNCPLCGGKRYENDYGTWCLNDPCPNGSKYPNEESIIFGWMVNPDYMKRFETRWVYAWDEMGKDYKKWQEDNVKKLKIGGGDCCGRPYENCVICGEEVKGLEQDAVPYSDLYPVKYRGRKVHKMCVDRSLKLRLAALEVIDNFEASGRVDEKGNS